MRSALIVPRLDVTRIGLLTKWVAPGERLQLMVSSRLVAVVGLEKLAIDFAGSLRIVVAYRQRQRAAGGFSLPSNAICYVGCDALIRCEGPGFGRPAGGGLMDRRDFNKLMGATVAGMLVGSKAFGQEKKAEEEKEAKHVCKGKNDCKGQGGCKTENNECAGKNDCKGKGGCATTAHHDCAGKNDCKGQGGCGGTQGKNDCKGKGGCAVPLKPEHQKKK